MFNHQQHDDKRSLITARRIERIAEAINSPQVKAEDLKVALRKNMLGAISVGLFGEAIGYHLKINGYSPDLILGILGFFGTSAAVTYVALRKVYSNASIAYHRIKDELKEERDMALESGAKTGAILGAGFMFANAAAHSLSLAPLFALLSPVAMMPYFYFNSELKAITRGKIRKARNP